MLGCIFSGQSGERGWLLLEFLRGKHVRHHSGADAAWRGNSILERSNGNRRASFVSVRSESDGSSIFSAMSAKRVSTIVSPLSSSSLPSSVRSSWKNAPVRFALTRTAVLKRTLPGLLRPSRTSAYGAASLASFLSPLNPGESSARMRIIFSKAS